MPEEKETSLIPLTPEELDAAASEVFEKQQPSEPDPALKLINDRLDLSSDQDSYREQFLKAAEDSDWRRKVPALAKEYFETLHRLEEQKRFLHGYGQTYPELTAEDPWYTGNIARIAFLESSAPDASSALSTQPLSTSAAPLTAGAEDQQQRSNAFYRSGDVWAVCYEGKTYHFQHTVGFQYIWILLRHSGQELAAKRILALCNAGAADSVSEQDVRNDDLSTQDNLQERSDSLAIAQCEARAREIGEEITKAKRNGEEAEVTRLRNELEQIAEHIAKDRALSGKTRKFSNDDERARSTVTIAIKRAREEMGKRSSEMANYFKDEISTGKDCIFRDAQTTWRLDEPTTTKQ